MEFIAIDAKELSLVALFILVGGALGWRGLGVLDVGLRYLAEALRDFTQTVRKGNQIDEKQTRLIERLDARLAAQSLSLDQTAAHLRDVRHAVEALRDAEQEEVERLLGQLTTGFQEIQALVSAQLAPLIASIATLERSIDQLPHSVQAAVKPMLEASLEALVKGMQHAMEPIGGEADDEVAVRASDEQGMPSHAGTKDERRRW